MTVDATMLRPFPPLPAEAAAVAAEWLAGGDGGLLRGVLRDRLLDENDPRAELLAVVPALRRPFTGLSLLPEATPRPGVRRDAYTGRDFAAVVWPGRPGRRTGPIYRGDRPPAGGPPPIPTVRLPRGCGRLGRLLCVATALDLVAVAGHYRTFFARVFNPARVLAEAELYACGLLPPHRPASPYLPDHPRRVLRAAWSGRGASYVHVLANVEAHLAADPDVLVQASAAARLLAPAEAAARFMRPAVAAGLLRSRSIEVVRRLAGMNAAVAAGLTLSRLWRDHRERAYRGRLAGA